MERFWRNEPEITNAYRRFVITRPLRTSLPGLTRQSMMKVQRMRSVRFLLPHRLMDARVKPAHDAECVETLRQHVRMPHHRTTLCYANQYDRPGAQMLNQER
jgi:hypothetical protein